MGTGRLRSAAGFWIKPARMTRNCARMWRRCWRPMSTAVSFWRAGNGQVGIGEATLARVTEQLPENSEGSDLAGRASGATRSGLDR